MIVSPETSCNHVVCVTILFLSVFSGNETNQNPGAAVPGVNLCKASGSKRCNAELQWLL